MSCNRIKYIIVKSDLFLTNKRWGKLVSTNYAKVPILKEVNFGKVKLWDVEHFWTLFVFTFGRDCYCIQQSRPKMKTKSVQKCSTSQSFTLSKWHSFKIGTLVFRMLFDVICAVSNVWHWHMGHRCCQKIIKVQPPYIVSMFNLLELDLNIFSFL